jgi:thiamine-phosphate pyrophosphorylase
MSMKFALSKPILYLITRGATVETSTAESPEFQEILRQVSAAIAAGIDLIQIREKQLSARVLFELTRQAVQLAAGTSTRVLVNDRADVARGAHAQGVHLTTKSIDVARVRRTFGDDFLIGASCHRLGEAEVARDGGADFAVIGPVFPTDSKLQYGKPLGLDVLANLAQKLAPFQLLALGGVSLENAQACLAAGASGIAGISLFANAEELERIVVSIRQTGATTV